MKFAGFLKRLKKSLRKRRLLTLGATLIIVAAGWSITSWSIEPKEVTPTFVGHMLDHEPFAGEVEKLTSEDKIREVFVKKIYICGEEMQSMGEMKGNEIIKLYSQHPDLFLESVEVDRVILSSHIDDISAKCKKNAFFGVNKEGVLNLYEGPPSQEKVIRSFFQLDVEYLKSSLPQEMVNQLYDGIQVSDYAQYNSVLSTFSDYAVEI